MKKGRLSAALAISLIAGCGGQKNPEDYLLGTLNTGIPDLGHVGGDNCDICRDINSEIIYSRTGFYHGYSVEIAIKESRWGEPVEERQRRKVIKVSETLEGKTIAEISAKTSWGTEEPFTIGKSSMPEHHPFEQYTPERLEDIYNHIIGEN